MHPNSFISRRRSSLSQLDGFTRSSIAIDPSAETLRRMSFGFDSFPIGRSGSRMSIDRRDSFGLGIAPSADYLPILRQNSIMSDFYDPAEANPAPRVETGSPKHKRKIPRSPVDEDDPFAGIKLGDQRRKMIKTAISEKCTENPALRERLRGEFGPIKQATVSGLMRMCEICGILPWALNLINSRHP